MKRRLWSYVGPDSIIEAVVRHLVDSSAHQMQHDDAVACVDEYNRRIEVGLETYACRQSYRDWVDAQTAAKKDRKMDVMDAADHASQIVAKTKSDGEAIGATSQARMTSMLRKAITEVRKFKAKRAFGQKDDADDIIDVVNVLTDNCVDALDNGPELQLKRGFPKGALPLDKRRQLVAPFNLDELRTIGHVMIRAKSTARTLSSEAEQFARQAEAFAQQAQSASSMAECLLANAQQNDAPIADCQADMVRAIHKAIAQKRRLQSNVRTCI